VGELAIEISCMISRSILSVAVRAAAQQAYASMESVASAVEELSVSIDGISDSATRSSTLSAKTTEGARSTDGAVQDLAENAREIERVISLIKQVAQQTNLLALNATIEAARAGQAGRGFAVVASEVKALAAQTGTATEEIEAQVSRIQTVTATCVTAIQDIVAKIGEMNVIATSVAAAVDQQRGYRTIVSVDKPYRRRSVPRLGDDKGRLGRYPAYPTSRSIVEQHGRANWRDRRHHFYHRRPNESSCT
jgi:methyl-accepting chemotaxis protein